MNKKYLGPFIVLLLVAAAGISLMTMTKPRSADWFVPYTLPLEETHRFFDLGIVPGNPVHFSTKMTTTVVVADGKKVWNWAHSRHGKSSDLDDSWAYSHWESTHHYSKTEGTCIKRGNEKNRNSKAGVTYTPSAASRNQSIDITNVVHFRLAYQKCWWAVFARACSRDNAEDTAPDASDDQDSYNQATTQIYLDGQPDGTFSGSGNPYELTPDVDVRIGMGGPTGGRFFTGLIDEVKLYDRALTDPELLWLAGWTEAVDKPF